MKIGILTLHSNTNFGGGLQQIALFETLKSLGHEPRVLCVTNNTCLSSFKRLTGILTSYSPRQLFNAVSEVLGRVSGKKTEETPNTVLYKKTDEFNYERLNYTQKFGIEIFQKYSSECDVLIFGSDQIWTDVYSDVLPYFGDGIPEFKGKKVAYAACSVHDKAPFYNRTKIRNLLSDFNAISVRDYTTHRLVTRYCDKSPAVVCDPTLLYDFNSYITPSQIKGDYIFAYVLGDKTDHWHQQNIAKIKQITGVKKVVALTTSLDDRFSWADIIITDALAIDWMNILRESAFVYTNSFHAVLFSLKFHRQFVAYYGDIVRSSRMIDLKDTFGLHDRIIKEPLCVDYIKRVDFDKIDCLIEAMKVDSLRFLQEAITGA